jgi:hypothetical protein
MRRWCRCHRSPDATRVVRRRSEVELGRDLRAAAAEEADREQLLAERTERQKRRDLVADKKLQEVRCARRKPNVATS